MNIVFSFRKRTAALVAPVLAALTLTLTGCSTATLSSSDISVVTSTDVWGDVAAHVAGNLAADKVRITSLITDPSADPHSYEANTRNQLAVERADVVLENGGGYDDFVSTMRKASGTKATVLDAVRISGHRPVDGQLNEHVWYDFPTVEKVAARLADVLAKADPAAAGTFRANARAFTAQLQRLVADEAAIRRTHAGAGVAATEPVALYLLQACGLVNKTPPQFSAAIEEGSDVPARVLRQTLDLVEHKQVAVLVDNEQTEGVETALLKSAAGKVGVPVVGVTETLPAGKDYLSWMAGNLADVSAALGKG